MSIYIFQIRKLGPVPIVKPSWITDSIEFGKLVDYRRYLLYTNQSLSQPRLQFPVIDRPSVSPSTIVLEDLIYQERNVLYSNQISNKGDTNDNCQKTVESTYVYGNEFTKDLHNKDLIFNGKLENETIVIPGCSTKNKMEENQTTENIIINKNQRSDIMDTHDNKKHDQPDNGVLKSSFSLPLNLISPEKKMGRSRASTKTASDPNFLEEFYNNSRLHLISTLGAEYKQLVNQLREKSDGKFPGQEKLSKGTIKNIISFMNK